MSRRHSTNLSSLEAVFLRLEELVLANSGEDEFEEIFKLLIAKIYDESSSGREHRKFRKLANSHETKDVIDDLITAADVKWPGVLQPVSSTKLAAEHLDVCVSAIENLSLLDHSLEALDSFFEFIVSRSSKGSKGQFFTPRHVVDFCIKILQPKAGEMICDPACGSGGFLVHASEFLTKKGEITKENFEEYCSDYLWGFDLDNRAIRIGRALMIISGCLRPRLFRINSLQRGLASDLLDQSNDDVQIEDIVKGKNSTFNGFDIIATNPPFAGEINETNFLAQYQLANSKGRVERDVLFIERCVHLLRRGGRMAIVLPDNKFSSKKFSYVRQWLLGECRVLAVISLGRNTFMPHTNQKASVIFMEKRAQPLKCVEDDLGKIFFGISERSGKDKRGNQLGKTSDGMGATLGWHSLDHDLDTLVAAYEKHRTNGEY